MNPFRRKSRTARLADSARKKVKRSGAAKTAKGAGKAGQAAGRSGKAVAKYAGRKASGKRTPILVGAPAVAGASVAGFLAMRKMRRGVKESDPLQ